MIHACEMLSLVFNRSSRCWVTEFVLACGHNVKRYEKLQKIKLTPARMRNYLPVMSYSAMCCCLLPSFTPGIVQLVSCFERERVRRSIRGRKWLNEPAAKTAPLPLSRFWLPSKRFKTRKRTEFGVVVQNSLLWHPTIQFVTHEIIVDWRSLISMTLPCVTSS